MDALSKIESAGFMVSVKDGCLAVSPASKLTLTQREFLKAHKAEIIRELEPVTLSETDQQKLLDYMFVIGEADEGVIDALLAKCAQDAEALAWALSWADKSLSVNKRSKMQTVTCRGCANFKCYNAHGGGSGQCGIGLWSAGYCQWSDDQHQCDRYSTLTPNTGKATK